MRSTRILATLLLVTLPVAVTHSEQSGGPGALPPRARLDGADSVVYRLAPNSRLEVKTGKAGLFGFAGHSHSIRARAFTGQVVYYPRMADSSHLEITVAVNSLEVLTPPDTAEIRKVTQTMRAEVLHTDQYPQIRLVSRTVNRTSDGFRVIGGLTLAGQTHDVPIDVHVELGSDTLRAKTAFAVKQSDFGIKPYSGGPAGTVKVADKVKFDIEVIAIRAVPNAIRTGR